MHCITFCESNLGQLRLKVCCDADIGEQYICMLRPDLQPLIDFETGRPVSKSSSRFRRWLLVLCNEYTVQNFTQAVCRKELGNDSVHVDDIFVINVANCSKTIDFVSKTVLH